MLIWVAEIAALPFLFRGAAEVQILREKRLADDRIGVTQSQTQNHAQAEMNFRFHVSSVFAKMFVASFEGFRFHIEISLQCHFIQILLQ